MFSRLKRTSRSEKAVFSTRIRFTPIAEEKFRQYLSLDETYTFDSESDFKKLKISGNDIASFINYVIENELKAKCASHIKYPIESINVIGEYDGSIIVFFEVILKVFDLVGGIKDVYESIKLIGTLANDFIQERLNEEYGDYFIANTWTRLPHFESTSNSENIKDRSQFSASAKLFRKSANTRDGFFFYLLISNIVLFVLLGFMVYKAVLAMYW